MDAFYATQRHAFEVFFSRSPTHRGSLSWLSQPFTLLPIPNFLFSPSTQLPLPFTLLFPSFHSSPSLDYHSPLPSFLCPSLPFSPSLSYHFPLPSFHFPPSPPLQIDIQIDTKNYPHAASPSLNNIYRTAPFQGKGRSKITLVNPLHPTFLTSHALWESPLETCLFLWGNWGDRGGGEGEEESER